MLASAHAQSSESKFRLLYLGSDLELITALRQVGRTRLPFGGLFGSWRRDHVSQ